VVGIVGAGGLGRLLTEQLSNFDFARITSTIITLILLTLLVNILSSSFRRTFRMG
jgi:phosphonate transport system permease protein